MTASDAPAALFQFQGARLGHGRETVFAALDLTLRRGETVALLGPSGSGKSTLLAALRRQQETLCAWCPQEQALVPMLSVFHNIYMGGLHRFGTWRNLRALVRPTAAQRDSVATVAENLGLAEKLFTSVDRLSGGQAQRTALGRALFTQRPVLLADEPVSNLDEHQGQTLLRCCWPTNRCPTWMNTRARPCSRTLCAATTAPWSPCTTARWRWPASSG